MSGKEDLASKFMDIGAQPADPAQDFLPTRLTTLIAGGFKLDQLLYEPYQSFHSTLARHVHEADAILIIGYGFGDLHVNRAIRNRFALSRSSRSDPKVVVVTKSRPDRWRTGRLALSEFWSMQVQRAFKTTFHDQVKWPSEDDRTVADLIELSQFEVSASKRVAIWHSGVCSAYSDVDRLIKRLSR